MDENKDPASELAEARAKARDERDAVIAAELEGAERAEELAASL